MSRKKRKARPNSKLSVDDQKMLEHSRQLMARALESGGIPAIIITYRQVNPTISQQEFGVASTLSKEQIQYILKRLSGLLDGSIVPDTPKPFILKGKEEGNLEKFPVGRDGTAEYKGLLAEAGVFNAKMDEVDGGMARVSPPLVLRTAMTAMEAGLKEKRFDSIAEALLMIQEVEQRLRIFEHKHKDDYFKDSR